MLISGILPTLVYELFRHRPGHHTSTGYGGRVTTIIIGVLAAAYVGLKGGWSSPETNPLPRPTVTATPYPTPIFVPSPPTPVPTMPPFFPSPSPSVPPAKPRMTPKIPAATPTSNGSIYRCPYNHQHLIPAPNMAGEIVSCPICHRHVLIPE